MEFLQHVVQANGILFTTVFSLMSLAAVFFVALRFIKNLKAHTNVDKYFEHLEQQLQTGGPAAVMETLERETAETDLIMPRLFLAAFSEGSRGKLAARDAMADCVETEIMPKLNYTLASILLLVKTAPMMGLLGTVVGMIGAFETIAGATKVDPSALANDIGMALFTTAEGLFIAIPLIFFYTLFRERISSFELDLQRGAQQAMKMLPLVCGRGN
jgi:biopolymer transport protein ExbB/TolQ